jgi:hypothetical protein
MKSSNMISLTGGLGNQLFQLAFVLSQSGSGQVTIEQNLGLPRQNASGNPEILSFQLPVSLKVLRKRRISTFNRRVVNFAMRTAISVNRRPNIFILKPVLVIASAITSIHLMQPRKIISPTDIGYSPITKSRFPKLFVGYFQSFRWADEVKDSLLGLKLLTESEELKEYIQFARIEKPLAVHVRLGDYVDIESFGIPSLLYYESAINEQFSKHNFEKIWLFSNDPRNAINFIPEKYRDRTRIIGEIGNSSAETLELMRHAKAYVIGNSTFSWWGAYLSYSEKPYVIAPNPWFKGEPSPNELIPQNWRQIRAFV